MIPRSDAGNVLRRRLYERYLSTHTARGRSLDVREASRQPYLDRLIRRWFPADRAARIMDLGCGDGMLLRCLQRHGYQHVRGVDTSPEQVALAVSRGTNVVCGDLLDALRQTPAESEDVIVAFDVLEHFRKPELLSIGDEACRALRPGGRLIAHVPNGMALLGAPAFFDDLTHETCFTQISMRQLLSVVGFQDVRIEEDSPAVHGATSAVRWLLWQVVRQGARVARAAETGVWSGGVFSRNLLAIASK